MPHGLITKTVGLTFALTGLAFMVTVLRFGAGFLIILAALGEQAVWLLPVHVVFALPAALCGGVLLTAAGPRASMDRPQAREVLTLAVIVSMVCVLLVGWTMPAANRASGASLARFQNTAVERPTESPASYDLPQLLTDRSPAAREHLRTRALLIAPCVVLGAIVTLLVASPFSWSTRTAIFGTVIVFVGQMRYVAGIFAWPPN